MRVDAKNHLESIIIMLSFQSKDLAKSKRFTNKDATKKIKLQKVKVKVKYFFLRNQRDKKTIVPW